MNKIPPTALLVVGVIAILIGGLWIGQGLNIIGGSFMSGSRTWFTIGVVVAVLGIVSVVRGVRRRR